MYQQSCIRNKISKKHVKIKRIDVEKAWKEQKLDVKRKKLGKHK